MTKNKLGIIGGSGLYEIEGLQNLKWKTIETPWGNPSDQILNFNYKGKKVCFYQGMPEVIKFRQQILILELTLML